MLDKECWLLYYMFMQIFCALNYTGTLHKRFPSKKPALFVIRKRSILFLLQSSADGIDGTGKKIGLVKSVGVWQSGKVYRSRGSTKDILKSRASEMAFLAFWRRFNITCTNLLHGYFGHYILALSLAPSLLLSRGNLPVLSHN